MVIATLLSPRAQTTEKGIFMKHFYSLALSALVIACGNPAPQRPLLSHAGQAERPASVVKPATADADVEQEFTAENLQAMQAQNPVSVVPAPAAMESMQDQVSAAFAASNLAPADSAALNADVQAMLGAAQANNLVDVAKLANKVLAKAKGLAGAKAQVAGLLDLGKIVKAVQDLAGAAVGLDIAGALKAVQDLIAAIGV